MTRKAAIGWRTTRRLSGERGVGCRFSVTAGMIGLLSRSVLSDRRVRIQARRSGYRLLLAVYVDGPYAEGHDADREVAHGAQAQDCPHGRRLAKGGSVPGQDAPYLSADNPRMCVFLPAVLRHPCLLLRLLP